jgi:hypothetical protein
MAVRPWRALAGSDEVPSAYADESRLRAFTSAHRDLCNATDQFIFHNFGIIPLLGSLLDLLSNQVTLHSIQNQFGGLIVNGAVHRDHAGRLVGRSLDDF